MVDDSARLLRRSEAPKYARRTQTALGKQEVILITVLCDMPDEDMDRTVLTGAESLRFLTTVQSVYDPLGPSAQPQAWKVGAILSR
jgi:hypothetical protein